MIEAVNLHKSFGDVSVLDGASFDVARGTIAALVGPNGTGKTTTLHLLSGLTAADKGSITVDGFDVRKDRTAALSRMAFLPQDVRFHDALTPRQVLRFYADIRGADRSRIDFLLERVDLTAAARKPCGTLSGGMRQRLGLALLALAEPEVLLLDEPGLSLDPYWRGELMRWLRECADTGTTVVMATHLLEIWTPTVDQVLTCSDGLIRNDDTLRLPEGVREHAGLS